MYLEPHQVPSSEITQWVVDNYNTTEYTIISEHIVYDTGCWKPEFPSNPFCRIAPVPNN